MGQPELSRGVSMNIEVSAANARAEAAEIMLAAANEEIDRLRAEVAALESKLAGKSKDTGQPAQERWPPPGLAQLAPPWLDWDAHMAVRALEEGVERLAPRAPPDRYLRVLIRENEQNGEVEVRVSRYDRHMQVSMRRRDLVGLLARHMDEISHRLGLSQKEREHVNRLLEKGLQDVL